MLPVRQYEFLEKRVHDGFALSISDAARMIFDREMTGAKA